jgi:hypothetical protein
MIRNVLMCAIVAHGVSVFGEAQTGKSRPSPPTVSYKVIEEWRIPNGGYGRRIVIPTSLRTEAGMRALGDKLRKDTKGDRHAEVQIFDSERAAKMVVAMVMDRLSRKDLAYYDAHMLGSYGRNGLSGYDELTIMLQGPNGRAIVVKY